MMRRCIGVLALMILSASCACPAAAKRVALVIGNSNYQHEAQLSNPANDAHGVSAALRRIGFDEVLVVIDGDLKAMNSALAAFARSAETADLALVYYSGHGIEVDSQNYLIPIDAKLSDSGDVYFETVPLELVVRATDRAAKVKLIVLDACRNNPFQARMVLRGGSRAVGRGLADVKLSAGTLVAYAARAGTVAEDGPRGGNSPFTSAFLKYVEQPRIEVRLMLGRVRDEVVRATRRQEPGIYVSLGGEEVYLNPQEAPASTAAASQMPPPPQLAPQMSEVAQTWRLIEGMDDPSVFEAFRQQFGASNQVYDQLAANRIAALRRAQEQKQAADRPKTEGPQAKRAADEAEIARAWAATKDTTSPAVLEAFIQRFADSSYADMARARLKELRSVAEKKDKVAALTPPAGARPTGGSACAKLVGVWLGPTNTDMIFKADRTVTSPAFSDYGPWSCNNGQVVISWKQWGVDRCSLSPEGTQMTCTNSLIGNSFVRTRKSGT